jgi:hypothetical protein
MEEAMDRATEAVKRDESHKVSSTGVKKHQLSVRKPDFKE